LAIGVGPGTGRKRQNGTILRLDIPVENFGVPLKVFHLFWKFYRFILFYLFIFIFCLEMVNTPGLWTQIDNRVINLDLENT